MTSMGETLTLGSEKEPSRIGMTEVAEFKLVSGGGIGIGVGVQEDLIDRISKAEHSGGVLPLK